MIPLKKFAALPSRTRIRKLILIFRQWALQTESIHDQLPLLCDYLTAIDRSSIPQPDQFLLYEAEVKSLQTMLKDYSDSANRVILLKWSLYRILHILESTVGIEPADWDLKVFNSSTPEPLRQRVYPIRIYLDEIRSPYNIGSIFRTAVCFGIEQIYLAPGTASPVHPRASRTAMGCVNLIPWKTMTYQALEEEPELFALETGGCDLQSFSFPAAGTCILGSEELGVHPSLIKLAKKRRGIVSIPLYGAKGSLNVSVAAGILMQQWVQQLGPRLETIRT